MAEHNLELASGHELTPLQIAGFSFFKCIFLFIILFIYGCAGSSLLRGLFSGCSVWTSHYSGFSSCGARALGLEGFSSCGAWAPLQLSNSRAQAQ